MGRGPSRATPHVFLNGYSAQSPAANSTRLPGDSPAPSSRIARGMERRLTVHTIHIMTALQNDSVHSVKAFRPAEGRSLACIPPPAMASKAAVDALGQRSQD